MAKLKGISNINGELIADVKNITLRSLDMAHTANTGDTYILSFSSSNQFGLIQTFSSQGTQLYTNGTHTLSVPAGVTSMSAFVVGGGGGASGCPTIQGFDQSGAGAGGGSAWGTFSVTPGEVLDIQVGAGGSGGTRGSTAGGDGGDGGTSYIRRDGQLILQATGGTGREWQTTNWAAGGQGSLGTGVTGQANNGGSSGGSNSSYAGGGGGAGGYSGNGGAGAYGSSDGTQGSGGGGGGGGGTSSQQYYVSGGGGGVGMLGEGTSGARGTGATNGNGTGGGGGSGASNANGRIASIYGGGAGGTSITGAAGMGGQGGAVRIIWGAGRSYPDNAT
jgi:hypothetical protein